MWGSLYCNSANFTSSSKSQYTLCRFAIVVSSFYLCFILNFSFIHTPSHIFTCSIIFPIIRFHYDVMKKKYGDNIQLLFTDTDSLMYEVCTDDFYQDMWAMKEEFDLASYPKSSPFYDPSKNKVVGKFKDEAS